MKKNTSRQIMILQLFDRRRPAWTVEQMRRALKIPTSTIYRHVRNLVGAQFLAPVTGAAYALGPAFIKYESIIHDTDPLIRHADPIMNALLAQSGSDSTVMISKRFKDCVMCVHEVHGAKAVPSGYGRGVEMPIFAGATSKAILAQLSARALKSLYLENHVAIRRRLKIRDWNEFAAIVKQIRKAGYVVTKGEVTANRVGIAAPITRHGRPVASLTLSGNKWGERRIAEAVPVVRKAADEISASLSRDRTLISR